MKEFNLRLHEVGRERFNDWTYTILADVDQTEITKRIRDSLSSQLDPLVIAKPPDILEKMKTAKNIKFFLKDKVLRIENKNIEDTEWLEEFGEEYFFKDGVDIIAQLYIWMKAGIKIEFKA